MSEIRTLGPVGLNPLGNYNSQTEYEKLDVVLYQGSSYVALKPVQGIVPTNAEYWQKLVSGGVSRDEVPLIFNTVAEMKSAEDLVIGDTIQTLGYYAVNDGGGATYKITDEESETEHQEELGNGLYATLIIENNKINVKQYGVTGDGVTDDTESIQKCLDKFLPLNKTIYFPNGTYIISDVISVKMENYSYIKLDSKAEIKTDTDINELFNISKSASFFTIDGGIFNANNHANYCINSPSTTNKYSPNYKNIIFKNAKLSCFLSKDSSHTSGSEHGYIYNCKVYNELTLATGLEIYGGDYTVESCEIFLTNLGIKSGSILTLNDIHIWAGGDSNPNNNTIGIATSGSRLYMNNMYFDGMNVCVDTGNKAITINASNILDFLPSEAKTNNPIVFNTRIASRILLSNLDIYSYYERVYKINYSNLDMGNINNQNVNLSNVYEQYGGEVDYNHNKVDYGNCIFNDTRNFKALTKAYAQTLENGKYYKIGYVVLRNNSVTGGHLNFACDDINKYSQDIFFTLYLNNGEVIIQSNKSIYNSGIVGKIGVAVGAMETITGLNNETIYVCPIYLHIVENPGNGFGISVTAKSVNVGNWIEFFPYHKIDTNGLTNPTLLFDDTANN